jgi:outer membrane protein OmpA-like peptidoglycan-associated protein
MKIIGLLLFIFSASCAFAQKKTGLTIYFDTDKYDIRPRNASLLDSLAATLSQKKEGTTVEISGHCDDRGRDTYNDTLSLKRARSVENYLLSKGLDQPMIIKVEGFGETMPISEDGPLWQERRVEILITIPEEKVVEAPIEKPVEKPVERTLTKTIEDTATKKGATIVLKNLNFVGGNHILLPQSMPIVEELLSVMKNNPQLVISIQGHICCEPGNVDGVDFATGDRNLSVARAAAIHNYLLRNGISSNRISYQGFGHSVPIYPYPERSEEERVANRRVEIVILNK